MNYFLMFLVEKDVCKEYLVLFVEMVGICFKLVGNRMLNFFVVNFYMVIELIVKIRIYYIFWRVLLNKIIVEK